MFVVSVDSFAKSSYRGKDEISGDSAHKGFAETQFVVKPVRRCAMNRRRQLFAAASVASKRRDMLLSGMVGRGSQQNQFCEFSTAGSDG
ncbi:hypothetical protein D3871_12775 [Noviherbaspirillum saxi]|uniref:Uncharacterized protein n=1 Tax=Noviherbaspirillum saxi TaxID=2320863 RepID=A0A3A3FTB9_9BURK|nr:hypothetical protein D3871_12775 [Noviherbaspirillum saxi]